MGSERSQELRSGPGDRRRPAGRRPRRSARRRHDCHAARRPGTEPAPGVGRLVRSGHVRDDRTRAAARRGSRA